MSRGLLPCVLAAALGAAGCDRLLSLGSKQAQFDRDRAALADSRGDATVVPPGPVHLDPTFAGRGYLTFDGLISDQDYASGAVVDSKRRIVVVGQLTNSRTPPNQVPNKDAVVWRFLDDGSADDTFGQGGKIVLGQSNWDFARGVALDAQGAIVVGGNMEWSQLDGPTAWRFQSGGAPDPAFGSAGVAHYSVGGHEVTGTDLAFASDSGEVVLLGNDRDHTWISIGWLTAAGTPRLSFGTGEGHVEQVPPGTSTPQGTRLRLDRAGRVLVVGSSRPDATADLTIWRFLTNGFLDTSFNSSGFLTHNLGDGSDEVGADLDINSQDNIYVCGTSSGPAGSRMVVWKLQPNGTLATSFGGQGFVTPAPTGSAGSACRLDATGRLLVAGTLVDGQGKAKLSLWRLRDDGSLDPTLPGSGYGDAFPGRDEQVRSLTLDGASRVIVCGNVGIDAASDMVVWRLEIP
jgi:uncharacterized delta-60 repeat protein